MENHTLLTPTPAALVVPSLEWRDALPALVGERCTLRELRMADAAVLTSLVSTPEVARYISAPPVSAEQFGWFIDWSHREREGGRYAAFAVVPHAKGTPAGLLQLRQLDPSFHSAEWGVVLGSPYWGSGLFVDAARLLIEFAFGTVGVRRLEARAAVPNARGHAAMAKLGAVQEGVLRRSLITADGQVMDQVLWSLLSDEWRPVSRRAHARVH